MEYQEALAFLEYAGECAGDMGLEAIGNLLEELGNPQKKLKFVHVGGTNGKGSVAAYMSYMLAAAGYRVGRYISPTIFDYRERIQTLELEKGQYKSKYISKENVGKWMESIKKAYKKLKTEGKALPSPFEIETVMGFLEFLERDCHIVVLEVGLGGRIDATNIIEKAECTVFTSISLDHTDFLGDTLAKIAEEKAGIIKSGGNVAAYDYEYESARENRHDTITPVLKKKAKEMHADIAFADFSAITEEKHSLGGISFGYKSFGSFTSSLLGMHQVKNAVVAIEGARLLEKKGWNITNEHMREGIFAAKWRGRFEIIGEKPVYIVDGAHNPDAAKNLRQSIDCYLPGKKILYIMGILADKDYKTVLSYVGGRADKIITITPDNQRALPADKLRECALHYCSCVVEGGTMEQALRMAREQESEYDVILIFGSLYSLHSVYEYFGNGEGNLAMFTSD